MHNILINVYERKLSIRIRLSETMIIISHLYLIFIKKKIFLHMLSNTNVKCDISFGNIDLQGEPIIKLTKFLFFRQLVKDFYWLCDIEKISPYKHNIRYMN